MAPDADSNQPQPLREILSQTAGRFFGEGTGYSSETGLLSGFEYLDQELGGFRRGQFVLLAGVRSVGVTAFALSLALNMTSAEDDSHRVLFVHTAFPNDQLGLRCLAMDSGVPFREIAYSPMTATTLFELKKSMSALNERHLFVDANNDRSAMDIGVLIEDLRNADGLDLVIVDSLDGIRPGRSSRMGEDLGFSRICKKLKETAEYTGIPIILTARLPEPPRWRLTDEPSPLEIRRLGISERDFDVTLLVHRTPRFTVEDECEATTILVCDHRRNHQCGVVLEFHKKSLRFYDRGEGPCGQNIKTDSFRTLVTT